MGGPAWPALSGGRSATNWHRQEKCAAKCAVWRMSLSRQGFASCADRRQIPGWDAEDIPRAMRRCTFWPFIPVALRVRLLTLWVRLPRPPPAARRPPGHPPGNFFFAGRVRGVGRAKGCRTAIQRLQVPLAGARWLLQHRTRSWMEKPAYQAIWRGKATFPRRVWCVMHAGRRC